MLPGVADSPPPDLLFETSLDDETCPNCGWDREPAILDHQKASEAGVLIAVEKAEGSPFTAMAGLQLLAFYLRCPQCGTFFTTEEELNLGGMA